MFEKRRRRRRREQIFQGFIFSICFSFFSFVGAISRCMAFSFSHQKLLDHVVPSSPGIGNEFIWLSITLEWRIKTHSHTHQNMNLFLRPKFHLCTLARSSVGPLQWEFHTHKKHGHVKYYYEIRSRFRERLRGC